MIYENPKYNSYGLTQWMWLVRHREKFKLGKKTQIGAFTVFDAREGIEVQDNVKIGFGCVIISYSSIDKKKGRIMLKKNSCIGSNTTILPGVIVGENSIIGANSLVNKNIPDSEVWVGVPARFLKRV
jgi:acetyltransferase-like isoleucine patch superfamily enzyme